MPRPPRADAAGGLYHALNRGSARARFFGKEPDYEAFERVLAEGLNRYWLQEAEPDPALLSAWPIARLPNWVQKVKRLGLESTVRPRGRPHVRFLEESPNNES
jgi:hypothetical protein